MKTMFAVLLLIFSTQPVRAETLSAKAIFYRCYGHLAQKRPSRTDPLLIAVQSGQIDAITACMQVLQRAKLSESGGYKLVNSGNASAKAVFDTFHRLHSSWFSVTDLPALGRYRYNADFFDSTAPALYLTRALFDSGVPVNNAVSATDNLLTYRTNMNVELGPRTGNLKSYYEFRDDTRFAFAPVGELLGLFTSGPLPRTWTAVRRDGTVEGTGTVDFAEHFGAGYLGTLPYLLKNVDQLEEFRADGGELMPRKYARAVFSDAFCRELPVVRLVDAQSFVVPASSIGFRQSVSCVRCHASMDRLASTIRWFEYATPGRDERNAFFVSKYPQTAVAEAGWPSEPDPQYANRPPNGVLYFRNYKGDLINRPVTGLSDLGAKIAEQDDYYICTAKRYYQYFTGITAETGDIGDPQFGRALSAFEMSHRQTVIQLGLALKSHQSVERLIESILRLGIYSQSNLSIEKGN